ncbi:MAG: protein kinase, partial [Candidatus Eremiobacteraeota bacterium]|nr:protein kinase [Candidatus Eremiobacteraeota bacterium]
MSIDGNRLLPPRYSVIEELGRGGMSIVYRAVDTEHDREVAVKILKEDCASTERFRREARKLASLAHPNVVSFLEVGQHDGRDYLVMEYVGGGDLRAHLATGPSLSSLLETFSLVCAGLD